MGYHSRLKVCHVLNFLRSVSISLEKLARLCDFCPEVVEEMAGPHVAIVFGIFGGVCKAMVGLAKLVRVLRANLCNRQSVKLQQTCHTHNLR